MMNRKITIGIVVVVLILGGLAIWKYSPSNNINTENTDNNISDTKTIEELSQENSSSNADSPVEIQGISVEGSSDSEQGGLLVCVYKCGDGICQRTDSTCKAGDLSCICVENLQECPQDCSN